MADGGFLVAITSRNAGSVRTRTVGSALYNMTVQAGSIISSNVGYIYIEHVFWLAPWC